MRNFIDELENISTSKLIAENSVIVGLDIGDKTIGIAVSDRRIKIASGITTVRRDATARDVAKVKESVSKYNVGVIVFGWPLQMNGQPGSQCKKILTFVKELKNSFQGVLFSYWDERLSTRAVTDILLQSDLSREKRKRVVDRSASVYILQGAIDFLNRRDLIKI